MKKICTYFYLILTLVITTIFYQNKNLNSCRGLVETTTYAKVLSDCTFYKSSSLDNDIDNVYFVIPETYFVMVIDAINDECLKVQYGDFVGYIKSSSATIATFSPNVKTLENITFDIKTTSGTQVWSKPSAISSVLATIPAGTKNIKYIATAYGTIPSGGESNVWFYCVYTPEHNSTNVYEGYVYSENAVNLTKIIANTEKNPEPSTPSENSYDFKISSPIKIIIISIIAIPILILFLIVIYKIFEGFKHNSSNKKGLQSTPELANFNNYKNINNNYPCGNPQIIQNQSNYPNFQNENLRREISNMSQRPFVRKIRQSQMNEPNYPTFPSYDSDDDLL